MFVSWIVTYWGENKGEETRMGLGSLTARFVKLVKLEMFCFMRGQRGFCTKYKRTIVASIVASTVARD